MDLALRDLFLQRWQRFFPGAELPICFQHSHDAGRAERKQPPAGWSCLLGDLIAVRRGTPRAFAIDSIGCSGGKRYLGFDAPLRPHFEHFLSCGIPGKVEGERYKRSPELVARIMAAQPRLEAPAPWARFTRWDQLQEEDEPQVVIFFATPDALAGLFTLANFREEDRNGGVCTPFCAGCGAIVEQPLREARGERQRAVLGMFDVSARPFVPADRLSFAVPWARFARMAEDMEESFLITDSWKKLLKRIER